MIAFEYYIWFGNLEFLTPQVRKSFKNFWLLGNSTFFFNFSQNIQSLKFAKKHEHSKAHEFESVNNSNLKLLNFKFLKMKHEFKNENGKIWIRI